ncbi:hypothetical protein [Nocardia fluminea]|uniref:hypothetical protein n=1 Tax=Nocardia fluminea TaxID=134984 RepID=UPI003795E984
MTDKLSLRLVPDELSELVEPLLPVFTPRRQGGGIAPTDERAVFTAVVLGQAVRVSAAIRVDGS